MVSLGTALSTVKGILADLVIKAIDGLSHHKILELCNPILKIVVLIGRNAFSLRLTS